VAADASAGIGVSVTDPGHACKIADADADAAPRASHTPSGRTERRPQITTALADAATLAELRRRGDWAIDEVKLAHWREGDLCLLSLVDGQPAGYTWVHERGCPQILPGLRLRLPPGMLYNFAGYTHPGFRGLGLQGLRHRAVLEHPRWASADALLGWVKTTNHASRRGQARSGYVDIGRVVALGTGAHAWRWCSSSLAAHGIRAERVLETADPGVTSSAVGGKPPT
jgi:GNAT superfamily N-acetyltransferase